MSHPVNDFITAAKLIGPTSSQNAIDGYANGYFRGIVMQVANVIERLDDRKALKVTHGSGNKRTKRVSVNALTVQIKGRKTPIFQLHIDSFRGEHTGVLIATEGKRTPMSQISILATLHEGKTALSDESISTIFSWVGEKVGTVLRRKNTPSVAQRAVPA